VNLAADRDCTGCAACYSICPHSAVEMKPDDEGFLRPYFDNAKCIGCGLCEKVCPVLCHHDARKPIDVLAARAKDDGIRMKSTSGGVFLPLSSKMIHDGGTVFGAVFDPISRKVVHCEVNDIEGLAKICGSKYVQSDVGDCYKQVLAALKNYRAVLFSGTPCQVAGLKRYCEVKGVSEELWERVYCVEVVCNSVPSHRVLDAFIDTELRTVGERPQHIVFRDKSVGWKSRTLKIVTDVGEHAVPYSDVYYALWQEGYTVRKCCRECKFKSLRSGADLTIGDAWGVAKYAPSLHDGKGVSAVLVNTAKGKRLWTSVSASVEIKAVSYEEVIRFNPALEKSPAYLWNAGGRRQKFWGEANHGRNIVALGRRYTRPTLLVRMKRLCVRVLRSVRTRAK